MTLILTGANPASEFRGGGDFSNIWWSSLIMASLLWERWGILHNKSVTKQWMKKWPYIANVVFWIVQYYGEKVAFVGFRWGDRLNRPPPGSW